MNNGDLWPFLAYSRSVMDVKKLNKEKRLRAGEVTVLGFIWSLERAGNTRIKQTECQDVRLLSARNVRSFVERLLDGGMLEKHTSGRRVYIRLTEEGKRIAESLELTLRRNVRKLERGERL